MAAGQGPGESPSVDEVKGASHGDSEGQPGDGETPVLDLAFEEEGGGITFESGVQGDDDLFHLERDNPFFEQVQMQMFRSSAIDRREEPSQDMIDAPKGTRFLDGVGVPWTGNDAQLGRISRGMVAEEAVPLVGETAAFGTQGNFFLQSSKGRREAQELGLLPVEEVKAKSFSGFCADARQLFEVGDQNSEVGGVFCHKVPLRVFNELIREEEIMLSFL